MFAFKPFVRPRSARFGRRAVVCSAVLVAAAVLPAQTAVAAVFHF